MSPEASATVRSAANFDEIEKLAQRAYHAYGKVTDHKNFRGEPMPAWLDLPPKIQAAWRAAVVEVRS